jgi:hypothetical protein
MKSSSESILLVCGDGSAAVFSEPAKVAAAEAIRLLDRVSILSLDDIASAAFLFLGWEEMVTVGMGAWLVKADEILGTQGSRRWLDYFDE